MPQSESVREFIVRRKKEKEATARTERIRTNVQAALQSFSQKMQGGFGEGRQPTTLQPTGIPSQTLAPSPPPQAITGFAGTKFSGREKAMLDILIASEDATAIQTFFQSRKTAPKPVKAEAPSKSRVMGRILKKVEEGKDLTKGEKILFDRDKKGAEKEDPDVKRAKEAKIQEEQSETKFWETTYAKALADGLDEPTARQRANSAVIGRAAASGKIEISGQDVTPTTPTVNDLIEETTPATSFSTPVKATRKIGKPAPADLQKRFDSDPVMEGLFLGQKTKKGYSVHDNDGKLMGFYK